MGTNGAVDELETSLTSARERGALYDIAAALDLLEALCGSDTDRAAERDAILTRLGVQRLPTPLTVLSVGAPAAA
jgi:hypothetical protein